MSDPATHKAILEQAYRRWNDTRGGSVDELMAIFADDIHWGSLAQGTSPLAFTGKSVGKLEVQGYFDSLLAMWEMVYYEVGCFIAEEDRVVMVGATKWTNKETGKTCETPKVDVWRFRDGRAVEFFEYYDTARMLDAARQ